MVMLAVVVKTRLSSSVTDCSGMTIVVIVEGPMVAISSGPLGTVAGTQFSGVYQSSLTGLLLQVALPANKWAAIKHEKMPMMGRSFFILPSQQKSAAISRQSGLAVPTPRVQEGFQMKIIAIKRTKKF